MKKKSPRLGASTAVLFSFVLLAVYFLGGCAKSPPVQGMRQIKSTSPLPADAVFQTPSVVLPSVGAKVALSEIPKPSISIGLVVGNDRRVLSSSAGLYIVRAGDNRLVYKADSGAEISIVGKVDSVVSSEVFKVEVGTYDTKAEAESYLSILRGKVSYVPEVVKDKYSQFYRLRFSPVSHEESEKLVRNLAALGLKNIRLIPVKKSETAKAAFIRLFNDEGERIGDSNARLIVLPSSDAGLLQLDGSFYRGRLEIFLNSDAAVTVINRLNLEDYLKGVVPAEMSGTVFPMLEALKAQAVAARTYAVKNLGQFSKGGYDLCASPLCQVYKGVNVEQELTSQAVEETRGIVATYNGELINSMYTSTCGGHTEDVENIFPSLNAPYLRGVSCYPESSKYGIVIKTNSTSIIKGGDGKSLAREFALLDTIGFFTPNLPIGETPVTGDGFELWAKKLVTFLGLRKGGSLQLKNPIRRGNVLFLLHDLLGWDRRTDKFLRDIDTSDLSQFEDFASFPQNRLKEISYLLREEIILPFPDKTLRLNESLMYSELAGICYRIVSSYDLIPLKKGLFLKYENGKVKVYNDGEVQEYEPAENPHLVYSSPGISSTGRTMLLRSGDRIKFVLNPSGRLKFLELEAHRKGLSDDRFSSLYFWQSLYTADQLEEQVNRYVRVGQIKAIVPVKEGVSGRVVLLRIEGTKGQAVLRGLEIRRVLGIKENLFVMETLHGSNGEVSYYIFSGKGWGHGVGLCQVGAYGMALRGKSYSEILKHYYTGIELGKITTK